MNFDKRTIIVLGALIGGMTLAGGLLLLLEPGSVSPRSMITLYSEDRSHVAAPEDRLFALDQIRDWRGIVIHDSGSMQGSARSIGEHHDQILGQGLGYHFVINNGKPQADGLIEMGFRWEKQYVGNYLTGHDADIWNTHYIGIVLVGNTDQQPLTEKQLTELVWLIQHLQARFNIPRDEVYAALGSSSLQTSAYFPHAWFRQQLLD